mgnify:CR=1 FL=1
MPSPSAARDLKSLDIESALDAVENFTPIKIARLNACLGWNQFVLNLNVPNLPPEEVRD